MTDDVYTEGYHNGWPVILKNGSEPIDAFVDEMNLLADEIKELRKKCRSKKINKAQARAIKKSILNKLTEDTEHNQAIFNKKEGYAVFNGTDLEMVMKKVVDGIWINVDG